LNIRPQYLPLIDSMSSLIISTSSRTYAAIEIREWDDETDWHSTTIDDFRRGIAG
jgi:hypothetical protein